MAKKNKPTPESLPKTKGELAAVMAEKVKEYVQNLDTEIEQNLEAAIGLELSFELTIQAKFSLTGSVKLESGPAPEPKEEKIVSSGDDLDL